MLNITQNDYNIVKQRINERYIKINILDFQYRTVDEISGNMLSCSVNCDADSDLRRSCSVSLVVKDNSFDVHSGGKIWLDKYIQVYIGLKNIYTQEIQWYNQGIYLIDAPSWRYDATNNTLSFSGLDLMSKLTGARNGQLQGMPTVIKQGESVRKAMIATLALGGFTKYVVSECVNRDGTIQAVPYDIEIDQGGFVYDILSALRDILPQYQIYFDINGVFHYDLIPTGDDEPVVITDDIWKSILIGEDISTDFASVKNYVEVYGHTHEPKYYTSNINTPISLPSEYIRLEYIESTKQQAIDTGVVLNSTDLTGTIDFQFTQVDNNNEWIAGAIASDYATGIEGGYYHGSFYTNLGFSFSQTGTATARTVASFVVASGKTNNYTLILFGRNVGGTVYPDCYAKIYGSQIFNGSTKIRDFIPAKRVSDGMVGMYDLVTSQFFVNAGTGSFIAGGVANSVISMTVNSLQSLNNYDTIGFTLPSAVYGNIQLSVNSFGAKNLVDSNGNYITSLAANTYYVAMYQSNGTWLFLGHRQAQAVWSDNNPDSPFYINGPVGVIRQVLCGGDYENIQSDELALERAKIEIYWKCRLNDSITLNIVPIPWLDVNIVVSHAPKDEVEEKRYIIKSYSVDYGSVESTMSVSMISYYGYYPMY